MYKGCRNGVRKVYKYIEIVRKGVPMVYKGCTIGVVWVYKIITKGIQRVYKDCIRGVESV